MRYPHLAARIFNTPLLVHPGKLDAIIAGLGDRLVGASVDNPGSVCSADAGVPAEMFSTKRGERSDGGYRVVDGVAVISASGALVHRTQINAADSTYLLGYDELAGRLEAAVADPEVHAVLQVFDSPGGEVSGAFEYADRIHATRGAKPLWAVADSMAASAAYLAAAAFDELAVAATGYVGSIGVVMRHVDMSHALHQEGVKVTHIFAGARKVDGSPYEPLGRDVQARYQQEVDDLYGMFVAAVARYRAPHGLGAEAVAATQADTYRGAAGVALGLADRTATTDQLLTELAALRARKSYFGPSARQSVSPPASPQGARMSGITKTAPPDSGTPQDELAAAREDGYAHGMAKGLATGVETGRTEGLAQGRTEGAEAERARIRAVREQSLAGHEALIEQLAFDGHTTAAEAASAVLAAERTVRAAAAQAHFNDAPAAAASSPAPVDAPPGKSEQVAAAKAYAAQHGTDFVGAMKALGYAA